MNDARLPVPTWTIVLAMLFPTLGAIAYFVVADPSSIWFQGVYSGSKIIQFAWPVAVLAWWWPDRLRRVRWSAAGWLGGALFGLATMVLIGGVYALAYRDSPAFVQLRPIVHEKISGFGLGSPAGFVFLAIAISLVHSLAEEYYWRWFVFERLAERLRLIWALVLSAAAFTSHHVIVLHVYFPNHPLTATLPFALGIATGGMAWAWWYRRRDGLAGPWLGHVGADLGIMAVGHDLLFKTG